MPKFNVLLLVLLSLHTHVIVNHLNLKYRRRSVMAEWLTHLTKDIGGIIIYCYTSRVLIYK